MPSHKIHLFIDRYYLGTEYPKVHRLMDSAYPYLGRKHRVHWHDPASAMALAASAYPGDNNAIRSALLHIQVDNACSANPALVAILELKADKDLEVRKLLRMKRR